MYIYVYIYIYIFIYMRVTSYSRVSIKLEIGEKYLTAFNESRLIKPFLIITFTYYYLYLLECMSPNYG